MTRKRYNYPWVTEIKVNGYTCIHKGDKCQTDFISLINMGLPVKKRICTL